MPGDVQKNDLVTGPYDEKLQNDMRSFESVAKEDEMCIRDRKSTALFLFK